jgi:hypothetical protein
MFMACWKYSGGGLEKEITSGEIVHEVCRGIAETCVDGRDLDDGAARRDEPVEAFALAQLREGAGRGVCGADSREGFKVVANQIEIDLWPEGAEALTVDVDACFKEALLQAEDDNARVDELFALDAGNDANDRVVK